MSHYKIVIIDDWQSIRNELRRLLEKHNDFKIIAEAENCADAKKIIQELEPDGIFLDIHIDCETEDAGMRLAEDIVKSNTSKKPWIVFISGYPSFIKNSLNEIHAVGFLEKPILENELSDRLEYIRSNFQPHKDNMRTKEGKVICIDDIILIQKTPDKDTVEIYTTKSSEPVKHYTTLKIIKEIYKHSNLCYANKRTLVNENFIDYIKQNLLIVKGYEKAIDIGDAFKNDWDKKYPKPGKKTQKN